MSAPGLQALSPPPGLYRAAWAGSFRVSGRKILQTPPGADFFGDVASGPAGRQRLTASGPRAAWESCPRERQCRGGAATLRFLPRTSLNHALSKVGAAANPSWANREPIPSGPSRGVWTRAGSSSPELSIVAMPKSDFITSPRGCPPIASGPGHGRNDASTNAPMWPGTRRPLGSRFLLFRPGRRGGWGPSLPGSVGSAARPCIRPPSASSKGGWPGARPRRRAEPCSWMVSVQPFSLARIIIS